MSSNVLWPAAFFLTAAHISAFSFWAWGALFEASLKEIENKAKQQVALYYLQYLRFVSFLFFFIILVAFFAALPLRIQDDELFDGMILAEQILLAWKTWVVPVLGILVIFSFVGLKVGYTEHRKHNWKWSGKALSYTILWLALAACLAAIASALWSIFMGFVSALS